VVFGQGVIIGGAEKELAHFIEKINAPAAWTIMGMGAIPTDHPLAVGMLGMHGNYGPNLLTNDCDVLIAIGMRFDDRVTGRLDKYAKQAKVIHLDIDPSEINKNVPTTVAIWGDCKESLPLLTQAVHTKDNHSWLNQFSLCYEKEYSKVIQSEVNPLQGEITMAEVIQAVNEVTKGDVVIVTDVGQHQMVSCRYAKMNHTRSNITSGGLGTMGFALPAAIGASLAVPDKTVLAVIGDGGFQMTLQELGTMMQSKIKVKILILNNRFLGMVRQWQELFHHNRYSFVDIQSPDYVKLASAYQIEASTVCDRKELKSAIDQLLSHNESYLLEVIVAKENNVFPMVPQGKGIAEVILSKEEL
jgi:acetolactate synthase-1/2/3 large subunit